ncbi:MAG: UvrD-helicase domain-containing protein, partial [Microthrixaceae bacterium]|nr:UvrD-helicase domain-containing protein [Microthrixaceae bacterium]
MTEPTRSESGAPPILQLDGPLPWGRLAIEASAGTGKTYALCHLAVRYIAEAGVPASGFLIVTFTRAATAELRWRIRKAILNRIEELRAGDPKLTPEDSDRHLGNLERAITEYDTITITTIHSFATQTVSSLGATSQYDPPRRFTTDDRETTRSACSDAIVRAASNGVDPELLPSVQDLAKAVSTAMQNPDITIEPSEPEGEPTSVSVLASLARDVVLMLRLRRINRHEVSFDDVLTSLRDSIISGNGSTIIESLRNRYRVVMIDEFQDTDPVQWAIFDAAFAERPNTKDGVDGGEPNALILVGDPKQSIYSFRGADISTYSAATRAQGTNRVALGTNYRSDGRVLKGLEVLLAGTTYGRGISFVPVKASEDNETRCALNDGSPVTPVQVRLALGDDIKRNRNGTFVSKSAQDAVWNDVVTTIHHTLDHVMIPVGKEADREYRHVKAQEIAVLVHSGYDAINLQRRLINSGVPAVLSRAGKVLESPAANQWRWLLDALARPSDSARARRFALGWFAGLDVQTVDKGDDATMVSLFNQLRSWLEVLRESGVASFVHRVIDDSGVTARVLQSPDGDRSVTDLLHIGELLQTSSTEHRPTVANLLDLLQVSDSQSGDEDGDEYARRIETQDSAVRIMTIWVSKGLEFPIVMAPTLFTDKQKDPEVVVSDGMGGRVFDLEGSNSERLDEAIALKINENLRLLYVALTRSSHQVTAWWAPALNTAKSPLSRVLFARDEDGFFDPKKYNAKTIAIPKNAEDAESTLSLAANSGGLVDISVIGAGDPSPIWNGPAHHDGDDGSTSSGHASGELAAAELDHLPSRITGRWSFSAMTSSDLV